jgi:uncharacterized heparinase superfamily protein
MIARYLRTLRHLRPSQWTGQIRIRVSKYWQDPAVMPGVDETPGRIVFRGDISGIPDPVPPQTAGALREGDFTFLAETRRLGSSPDWEAAGASRLWRYNLHYFDWLWSLLPENAPGWETAQRLTLDWIERHPPERKACGWEPYPTSLRLLNWSLLFGVLHRDRTLADADFWKVLSLSLRRQIQWLEKNLETHIQANHLLENLAALACAHTIFSWDDPPKSQKRIDRLLERELNEQILGDGMHYERSPMYHLRMLWLVEVLRLAGPMKLRPLVASLGEKMKLALAVMRHPDGGIPLLNDAALGIYHDGWSQQVADDGPWALPEAGYYGGRAGGDFVVIDAGPIGPDHQPGHAHADFFTFELSLGGQRVVTDTGVEAYDVGAGRSYDRSTAAHNTVEVGGDNSVEVWGGFRVGRRAAPRVTVWKPGEMDFLLEGEHDGYRHLPSKAIHRRRFSWQPGVFEISDQLGVERDVQAVARIHFAPGVTLEIDDGIVRGRAGDVAFRIETDVPGRLCLEESVYHSSFNQSEMRTVLCLRLSVRAPGQSWRMVFRWDKA